MTPPSPRGPLERYAAELETRDRAAGPPTAGPLRRRLRRALPVTARDVLRRALTRLVAPYSILRARRLARRRPLRLHLGCGGTRLSGWINVDLVGSRADLFWHLGRRLPIAGGRAEALFAEHLLEHLTLAQAVRLAAEARRLLAPGGVVRLGVPDFGRYLHSYAGRDGVIESYRPGRPTPLLALSEVAYLHGHRSLWDAPTLVALLTEAGFHDATPRPFGESAISPAPDDEARRVETLYVEATG